MQKNASATATVVSTHEHELKLDEQEENQKLVKRHLTSIWMNEIRPYTFQHHDFDSDMGEGMDYH